MTQTPALLALEDGSVWQGTAFGASATVTGEVCFNTAMTGYQEVLTDPSYRGQIVAMTAPHIGNTGVNLEDDQSEDVWVAGFAVRELSPASSWRATGSLDDYLARRGVPGISGIDTRRLTRHIRRAGAMRGALSSEIRDVAELVDVARSSPVMVGRDLVREVTTSQPYRWGLERLEKRARGGYAAGREASPATRSLAPERRPEPIFSIAAFDFGIKRNILDLLVASGFEVTVVPAATSADSIVTGGFDGVFLSNGPGDPDAVGYAVESVAALLGRVPLFGICLGHQIMGLAAGGRTFKLPFGHRGSNHPVRRLADGKIEITCQNHGFAVDPRSLSGAAEMTHVNLNDGTLEGMSIPGAASSVQYHPESGPGPHDARYLFGEARRLVERFEPRDVATAAVS